MTFTADPIYIVKLAFCIVILILGWVGYRKSRDKPPLYIGVAFGLFGVCYLATLLSLEETLLPALAVTRTLGYLLVIFALYRMAFRR